MIRVTIDREQCISCGNCFDNYPEFFEQNPDDEFSQVVEQYRVQGRLDEGGVPDELGDKVRSAADECPVEIIHVG
jgi:ferredoxin